MPNNNYILTPDGSFISSDELYHWGIKGMKWGVRRYQNPDGSLTDAGRRRQARLERKQSKWGTALTRKTGKYDDPEARKKRIDADIKEADDRVKFYGSKRAAKAAIKDEAAYAKSVNRGKAAIDTLKYGSIAAVPATVLLSLATGGAGGAAVVAAAASYGITGSIMGAGAAAANRYISKHANDQISYTNESEYGHDIVVTMKKRD